METLHRLLRAAREVLNLSQSDVAKTANVSTRTIARLETGSGMVSFKVLTRLRDYFEGLGVGFVAPTEKWDWCLVFAPNLAPPPEESNPTNRLYDPIPGRVLKAARVAGGWRQEEIATRAGIGHTTVRRLEKDDVTVRPELAYILQKKFEDDGFRFVKPDESNGWRLFIPPLARQARQ
ncbi:XRE family transcriptional regulator [Rhizobium ruizarguesonis]|uniref:helix-turn-helix transcriptional regulator n=1 Tax=Rhizobium ruizarguesonis TaxID=2081791 RepID=UPI0010321389|nr:helix-turn-helix transcriptional regulator [Rhizobium ruizarguesonis]TBD01857.1 XRE family transcriptional regulator [Rhizobium ruizarguesonis]TBD18003.1 XRE family transcriptional regulator [Rhizobium ruizarguesonis]TBE99246.1 XRE family transcriptional regulator [Rhizobium ruizarguesonis]